MANTAGHNKSKEVEGYSHVESLNAMKTCAEKKGVVDGGDSEVNNKSKA